MEADIVDPQSDRADACRNDVGIIRETGSFLGRAAGRAARPLLIIKTEKERREMEAGIVDPQYDRAGRKMRRVKKRRRHN